VTDLWFEQVLDTPQRYGETLFAPRHGAVWAVMRSSESASSSLEERGHHVLAGYAGLAAGIGSILHVADIPLSPSLEQWANHTGAGAELGGWEPTLISIEGVAQLAMSRQFDDLRVFATTVSMHDRVVDGFPSEIREDLTILTPASETVGRLVHRDDIPARNFDQPAAS
jgi:hypothetical protein